MKTGDFDIGGVICQEENRTIVLVVWVQDLGARESVPPCLAISVEYTLAVDLDVPGNCQKVL